MKDLFVKGAVSKCNKTVSVSKLIWKIISEERQKRMNLQKKILVVEDNLINRTMLREILCPQYQVSEAENGQEALCILKDQGEELSLILLDITMPVMDGYTFLSIMKTSPAYAPYASIPVIVSTQSDCESDEVAALSHGAADFIAKPYKPQVILHRVASIINLRETAAIVNLFKFDRLTGVLSKEFFYQRARQVLLENPDKEYDIICSDIENFKLINDVFGISTGDNLLREVADLYLRLVGEKGICSRFQGDQFACLIERQYTYTNEMFIDAASELCSLAGVKKVILKWGIYAIEDKTYPVEQMCDWALLAVESIKGQYGKYFTVYDETLRDKLLWEQAITDSMESALADGQFLVYLQPKYRIKDYRLSGAEALVRWNHPEWGLQSPAVFIPLFEKNGFITKLDQFVWNKACEYLSLWDMQGLSLDSISVNVSRADIYHADIANILLHTVKKHGIRPERLHLEITESAYTEDPHQIIDTINHLRQLGFVVEMDDFGSGYSSLNMLNQMLLDILKLDMKFIQNETAKSSDHGVLRFIMGLARSMNLSVIAEGVETQEQLERLRELGCDFVQGYYLAKPMADQEFRALMDEQNTDVRPENAALSDSSPNIRQNRFILIADEDPVYRINIRKIFETRFRVIEASSVETALLCISGYNNQLAAVILSLTLPKPDGFAVLEVLQREKAVWNIPVVTTANWGESLEKRALENGADDFADKLHSPESLYRRTLHTMKMIALIERERTLQQKACQDCLTGLSNRWGLIGAIGSLQIEDGPLAVYLFDLDNLKQINDTFGHDSGDRLIQQFGVLLRTHTRGNDILSRYGGDEFVVIMRNMKSGEHALKKGKEICKAVQMITLVKGFSPACTAGVAICDPAEPMAEMITRADQALYKAKTNSKGKCCLWVP